MQLSINDSFKTKEEVTNAMKKFADFNNIKYDIIETPRTITLTCKGKVEFGCDCSITATYRKKDNKHIIKRMKLIHKCPSSVNDFVSTDDFIKNEIYRTIGDTEVRIGDIVSILHNRGIKVSYNSVWNALRRGDEGDQEKENINNSHLEPPQVKRTKTDFSKDLFKPKDATFFRSDLLNHEDLKQFDFATFKNFHNFNEILSEFSREFVEINFERVEVHFYGKMFYYEVPDYAKFLFPVLEIKYYKRANGLVVYGLLYDAFNEPVIYSCLVTEDISDITAFKYFLKSLPQLFCVIEYDEALIKILEDCKINFFIKTRDVCSFVYSLDKNKENIEKVWDNCNYGNDEIPELKGVSPHRYLKSRLSQSILNINNLPECDVDFVMYAVYSLPFFDCINAIHKLAFNNLKMRKKVAMDNKSPIGTDNKSLFGNNVVSRIERLKSLQPSQDLEVDLINYTCECGRFQDLLMPCVHAVKAIEASGRDPYSFVSSVYSKEQFHRLTETMPVMNISIKLHSDKVQVRKGPGRPKKHTLREVEVVVN